MEMRLNHVSATESGDYFQVLFEEEEDSDKAYFLIQRQFEFSDGGRSYIESHDHRLCGHFRIKRAELRRDRFCLELPSAAGGKLEIKFDTDEDNFEEANIPGRSSTPWPLCWPSAFVALTDSLLADFCCINGNVDR